MSDHENKKRKHIPNSKETSYGFHNCTSEISNNEVFEEHFVDKSRFEEIEDKLEEMFAGIEDEHLMNSKPFEKNLSNNDYEESNLSSADANGKKEFLIKPCLKHDNSILKKSAIPTKAAKKSSNVTCARSPTQYPQNKDYNKPSINNSIWYLQSLTPQRKFSIEVNKELLQLSVKINDDANGKNGTNYEIKKTDMTLFPLNLESNSEVTEIETNILKDKIQANTQKKYSKYPKSSSCSNRKIVRKSETTTIRAKQQKIKHMRMYHLMSSENETEEKPLLTRDIEIKTRSPFILVKSSDNISVVNTITSDDSTEKLTRLKKPNNYAHERNTVKGCHSSTLSNRYDADTADSSWKCIFCKIGPHRKGLGDLFGPYLISSNCDEFRAAKGYVESLQKFRRNDIHNIGFPNKSVRCINEAPYSHIRNIPECSSYTLGMSRVSAGRYEIWIHEECAIWAPSLFVIGSRLVGLEAATWSSIRYECVLCLKQGALLCCLHRGCKSYSHLPCARELNWFLDESRLWTYCSKHTLSKF